MKVTEVSQNLFRIEMDSTEVMHLTALVVTSQRLDINSVAELIRFQMEYLSEMYFTVIKEPEPNAS